MENLNSTKSFGLFNFCVITSGTLRCGLRFGCRGTGKNFGKKKVGVISKKKKKVITLCEARFLSFSDPGMAKICPADSDDLFFFFFFRDHPNFFQSPKNKGHHALNSHYLLIICFAFLVGGRSL